MFYLLNKYFYFNGIKNLINNITYNYFFSYEFKLNQKGIIDETITDKGKGINSNK